METVESISAQLCCDKMGARFQSIGAEKSTAVMGRVESLLWLLLEPASKAVDVDVVKEILNFLVFRNGARAETLRRYGQ